MAGIYNIVADQGSTFNFNFTIKIDDISWDLSDYSARMQVRADYNTTNKFLDLSTANGDITLNSLGQVSVTVSATKMAAIAAGRWVYDIEFVSAGGEVTRVLEGRFIVSAEVTQ
jgi:hypothetical protein